MPAMGKRPHAVSRRGLEQRNERPVCSHRCFNAGRLMCMAELWYPHHSDPHFQSPAQNGTIPPPRVAQKSSRPPRCNWSLGTFLMVLGPSSPGSAIRIPCKSTLFFCKGQDEPGQRLVSMVGVPRTSRMRVNWWCVPWLGCRGPRG